MKINILGRRNSYLAHPCHEVVIPTGPFPFQQ
jgi:hypothetical protein